MSARNRHRPWFTDMPTGNEIKTRWQSTPT